MSIFSTATSFPVGEGPSDVVVADFNKDGKPELATANQRTNNISILLGTGTGSFGSANNFNIQATRTEQGRPPTVKSCIGELIITEKQAEKLEVKKSTRLSPFFEKCCLRQIANISYPKAAKEMEVQTGVKIGHTCLHRLVEKQEWSEPIAFFEIEETSSRWRESPSERELGRRVSLARL